MKELLIKTRRWLKNHQDVIVIPSDKGNNSVVLYKDDYLKKVNELLSDTETYKMIYRDPTDAIKMLHDNQYITDAGFRILSLHINT